MVSAKDASVPNRCNGENVCPVVTDDAGRLRGDGLFDGSGVWFECTPENRNLPMKR